MAVTTRLREWFEAEPWRTSRALFERLQTTFWRRNYGLGVEGDLGRRWDIRRSSRPCATRLSMPLVSPDSMFLPQLNSIEPPWYGPVCQMVWEGWHREVSPHPDQSLLAIPANAAML